MPTTPRLYEVEVYKAILARYCWRKVYAQTVGQAFFACPIFVGQERTTGRVREVK